jgi:hypothetical protein
MIYRMRTFEMTPSVGGESQQNFTKWMKKAMKYTNDKWPEVDAKYLSIMFEGPKQVFVTKHDSVEASQKWYQEFFSEDGMKKLFEELTESQRALGRPAFEGWNDTFFNEIPLDG